jgi:hypothetical protein
VTVTATSTSIIDVYSTIYNTASACSPAPTIANPEFNASLSGSWTGGNYDIFTDTNYYYNGPDSV